MAGNSIIVKGTNVGDRYDEAVASAAIYPGMIGELDSNLKIKPHATADADIVPRIVAIEDDKQGSEVGDQYASAALVTYYIPQPGDRVMLRAANGQNIAKGNKVSSNGDGYAKNYTAEAISSAEAETFYQEAIFGIAMEAKDMSDSSAADPSSDLFTVMVV